MLTKFHFNSLEERNALLSPFFFSTIILHNRDCLNYKFQTTNKVQLRGQCATRDVKMEAKNWRSKA